MKIQVGSCKKCGAPIYQPVAWHGTTASTIEYTCGCTYTPQVVIASFTELKTNRNIMQINKQPSNVTVTFSPKDYWLRKFDTYYALTVRIDMSDKGKSDLEGRAVMFLSEEEAKVFMESGFEEIM